MNRTSRLLTAALLALPALFAFTGERAAAQATAQLTATGPQASAHTRDSATTRPSAPRRIVPLRLTDTPEGARVTVSSDAPLDDYTSRRDGNSFYLLIPHAQAPAEKPGITGRGLAGCRIEQRDDDVLLTFRMHSGATVRVGKGFNRLDVLFQAQPPASQSDSDSPAPPEASPKSAPADDAAGEREIISQMRAQIVALEARIREIETKQSLGEARQQPPQQQTAEAAPSGATVTTSHPPVATAAHPAPADDDHDEMAMGTPRLQIQGFADVSFRASDLKGATNSFVLGQLDLFMTSRLSDKFSVLGELIVEAGQDNKFSFEVHRLLLRYAPNDYFNLSAGRYHSAIGYYNTAYHHGSWFQTTANRPFIFSFESKGGILPLHNVGLSVTGRIPSAPFGLRYVAEIGNGRASRSPLDAAVQTAVDENNGKGFNLGVFARPKTLPGFQTGFSVYRDNLTPAGAPKVGQTIMAAHIVYQNRLYELLNEAVVIRHRAGDREFNSPGIYTQFSRRFGNARPYFRYQYVNVPSDDPIFPDVGRRNGPSVGLRYDVNDFAAFKAQYDRTERRRLSTINELILQLAFTF